MLELVTDIFMNTKRPAKAPGSIQSLNMGLRYSGVVPVVEYELSVNFITGRTAY
jgi:hypothetical protein